MSFNKDELEIFIEILNEVMMGANAHQKIIIEKIIHKFSSIITMIENDMI